MKNKINITCILVDRANYGRLKPVLQLINKDSCFDLKIICTGSMLLERYGNTSKVVKNDGLKIFDEVYIELEGSNPTTMAKTIGLAIFELTNAINRTTPDFVIVIGDRSEALGAAIATVYQNYCLIHIQGGEITGSIDESARHAITKLAHYHFPSTDNAAKNIIRMGEHPSRVFNFGCPSADVVDASNDDFKSYSLDLGVGKLIDWDNPFLLVLFHPVTSEFEDAETQMNELLYSIKEIDIQTVIIWPNIDAGSDGVSQSIRKFREENIGFNLHAYKNFEPEIYIPLLKRTACAIGNSSSFIRDASFIGTPVVLVGTRQDGREISDAVIRVNPLKSEITKAARYQIEHGHYSPSQIYRKKGSS